MLNQTHIDTFNRDGFLLIRDVLKPRDLEIVKGPAGEIITAGCPLPLDERIIGLAKSLLGDRIVYFGSSSFRYLELAPQPYIKGHHLHHDAKGHPNNLFNRIHEPLDETYPVIRIAAYLEDYETHSGGIKVSPGSHKRQTHTFEDDMQLFNVPARAGDLVVFCHRLLHSPFALRLKENPLSAFHPWHEDKISIDSPDYCIPHHPIRRTIFIDYGRPSVEADLFIKNRAVHGSSIKNNIRAKYDSRNVREAAKLAEVDLRFDGLVVGLSHLIAAQEKKEINTSALRDRLSFLCDLNHEYSDYFPLTMSSPEKLFKNAETYRMTMGANKEDDRHMCALKYESPDSGRSRYGPEK